MRTAVLLIIVAILIGLLLWAVFDPFRPTGYSDIKADETVVFFRTSASLDQATQQWNIPIRGWIYEPADSKVRRAIFEAALRAKFDLKVDDETDENFTRRLNLLIADNERDKTIVVSVAGKAYTLPASVENGHFESTLHIPADGLEGYVEDGVLGFEAITSEEEARRFTGEVLLVEPSGISVISDIDDTVKVSNVTDIRSLLEHSFLLDFIAAPGMAELYDKWSQQNASFHFVSSSPWQLYSPLVEFLDDAGFPPAELNLKAVRFRDETLFDLFKKGTETKPVVIERILDTYPDRQFILVGDSGEQDPEVYADMLRERPEQIIKAYLRNVTGESPDNDRFRSVFASVDEERWELFDEPPSMTLFNPPAAAAR